MDTDNLKYDLRVLGWIVAFFVGYLLGGLTWCIIERL
jgi:hypothetical protein